MNLTKSAKTISFVSLISMITLGLFFTNQQEDTVPAEQVTLPAEQVTLPSEQVTVIAEQVTVLAEQARVPVAQITAPEAIAPIAQITAPKSTVTAPQMTVQEKKARFKALLIPAVNEVYNELMAQYAEVEQAIKEGNAHSFLAKLKKEYRADSDSDLLVSLKPHPKSIAIAQAAMESSWATSRFFREANNVFGVWSFNDDEPRIAALQKRGDKTIWVKKYNSVKAAVTDYYRTIARSHAFSEFRQLRMTTNDPYALVKKLDRYSEKGHLYGEELTSIIKFNKFHEIDGI